MGTVISELFDESGMSVQAFADKAGLKYGTAYDIARGISKVENIGAGAFVRIAHVFGKTADELFSDMPIDNSICLTPDEQELVGLYRGIPDFGRRAVMNLARDFRENTPRDQYVSRPLVDDDEPPYEATADDIEELDRWNAEKYEREKEAWERRKGGSDE